MALNVLSAGAAYGSSPWSSVGAGPGLLDFTSTGAIASWLPMLMFVVLFGLSMDYHVFVLSRVREAYDARRTRGRRYRWAWPGLPEWSPARQRSWSGVFSVFGTLSSLEMKQLGVGLAAAVLLDATLVRGVMLPAVLSLLGKRAHTGPSWSPAAPLMPLPRSVGRGRGRPPNFVAVLHPKRGGTVGESRAYITRITRRPDQPGRVVVERFQPPGAWAAIRETSSMGASMMMTAPYAHPEARWLSSRATGSTPRGGSNRPVSAVTAATRSHPVGADVVRG